MRYTHRYQNKGEFVSETSEAEKKPQKEWLIFTGALLFAALVLIASQNSWVGGTNKTEELNAKFAPHRALYDINLASTRSGSQIVNISGQMLFEWQKDCEGATTTHRFNMNYEYADSPALNITSNFSTYETLDGQLFDFTLQRKRNGQVYEVIRGRADKEEGTINYTVPEGAQQNLIENIQFPTAHTRNVLNAVLEGETFFKSALFDGSDQEGPVEVNAFIGKDAATVNADQLLDTVDFDLLQVPAKEVRLAFFPLNSTETTSDYEMSLIFHENGVMRDIIIEYDDFSVSQKLAALEPLDDGCVK